MEKIKEINKKIDRLKNKIEELERQKEEELNQEEEFSFNRLNELHANDVENVRETDAKRYLKQYFKPCSSGGYYYIRSKNKKELINEKLMKTVYINRFPKDLKKWFKSRTDIMHNFTEDNNTTQNVSYRRQP